MTDQEVILLIDHIAGDDFCNDAELRLAFHPEELTDMERACIRKLLDIYTIAHSHDKSNSCYGVHVAWRSEAEHRLVAVKQEQSHDCEATI
jgi:hypothetical protein